MIRALRRRHLGLFTVLAVAVPAGLAAGLWSRTPVPAQEPPVGLAGDALLLQDAEIDSDDLWDGLPIRTRVGRDDAGLLVELTPREDLLQPDLLLYWSAAVPVGDGLPADVTLLGTLAGTWPHTYRLPATVDISAQGRHDASVAASDAASTRGHLTLYSLAHQSRVGSASLAGPAGSGD